MSGCRKARKAPIPYNCALPPGHAGRCSPFTMMPLRAEWEAVLDARDARDWDKYDAALDHFEAEAADFRARRAAWGTS